jgi:tRNA 2-thiocytidine biosynthesis protein TtcA
MKNIVTKRITRLVGRAIGDFGLIEDGDRVLVALSGGKDSWTLLYALKDLQRKAPVGYEIGAVTVHPGSQSFATHQLEERLVREGIHHQVVQGDILTVVNDNLTKGTNPCSFCSRLRRGILYSYALKNGWNKIALGHHLDDFVETLILNLFFNATIKGMSPNLLADDGKNRIIRPLVYVKEEMTRECAQVLGVPILGCSCPYQGMSGSRREWAKGLLRDIETQVPEVKTSLLAAMGRVHNRHLLTAWKQGPHPDVQIRSKKDPALEFP